MPVGQKRQIRKSLAFLSVVAVVGRPARKSVMEKAKKQTKHNDYGIRHGHFLFVKVPVENNP